MDGPLLWFLNRGTGVVLMALLTASTTLGILATRGRAGRGVPRFATQALHRNLALLSLTLLVAHVATAVLDTFVDIRWWQALLPWWGASYEAWWLGLGTLSLDLLIVVTLSSLVRDRLGRRGWRIAHQLSYAAWVSGVVHGIGIGTDLRDGAPWAVWTTVGCVAVVVMAGVVRLGSIARPALERG